MIGFVNGFDEGFDFVEGFFAARDFHAAADIDAERGEATDDIAASSAIANC